MPDYIGTLTDVDNNTQRRHHIIPDNWIQRDFINQILFPNREIHRDFISGLVTRNFRGPIGRFTGSPALLAHFFDPLNNNNTESSEVIRSLIVWVPGNLVVGPKDRGVHDPHNQSNPRRAEINNMGGFDEEACKYAATLSNDYNKVFYSTLYTKWNQARVTNNVSALKAIFEDLSKRNSIDTRIRQNGKYVGYSVSWNISNR